MSDRQDHSQSGFDPSRFGAGEARDPQAADEAQRFWGEYARRTRSGGQRSGPAPEAEAGNGHGFAAASHSHECLEWCPICRTADLLRASAPPELREQLQGLQRDALLTLRSLLDAYIERSGEGRPRGDSPVQDIPID